MAVADQKLFAALGWDATGDFGPWTFYTNAHGLLVFFLRAPPTKPATPRQAFVRWRLKVHARLWKAMTPQEQEPWETATKRLSLGLTGYNLFQADHFRPGSPTIDTIERQAALTLPNRAP